MGLVKPRAVLFDWDNTLVDTWPVIHEALHNTFVKMDMVPWTLQEVKQRVARSMRDAFPDVFGEKWQEAAAIYQAAYQSIHLGKLRALDGAREVLDYLKQSDAYVAVVSNKRGHNLRTEVSHLGWSEYFSILVGADDAEKDKPSPAPVLFALKPSELPTGSDIWLVGDSLIDMECAKNSGITAIYYGTDHAPDDASGTSIHGFPVGAITKNHDALMQLMKSYV